MKRKIKNFKKTIVRNKNAIILFIVGCGVGLIVMSFFIPDRISQLANGEEPVVSIDGLTITADELYDYLKNYGTATTILNKIDGFILDKKYKTNDDMIAEIDNMTDYYLNMAESYYSYTKDEFLHENGFNSLDEFKDTLLLDYKRKMYFIDYMEKEVKEKDVQTFYEKLTGPISGKYIISDESQIINDIIEKLNNGNSYNDIINTYGNNIISEKFENVEFDSEIDANIYNELILLNDNEYSNTYFEVTDGYALAIRDKTEKKDTLDNLKERLKNHIAESYANEDDGTKYNNSLNELRNSYNIKFYDTVIQEEYKNYLNNF